MKKTLIAVGLFAVATALVAAHGAGTSAVSAAPAGAGGGMRITFQSCGYRAVGLNVSCTNTQTGNSKALLLETGDTSPASCAAKLVTACSQVGYRAEQSGSTTTIYGSGIAVQAVGPVFTKTDF